MSKKKRVRRDIEKLSRVGRYWDFLRLLESEGLVSENAGEHHEAWKALIKKALQQERAFDEFCSEVGTLKSLPTNNPDFLLLMGLKEYIEGRGSAEEILELKGLNPDAQRLRSNFSAFAASATKLDKLRSLLARFVREPEKITGRFFEQVVDLLPDSAGTSAGLMGESISTARRFNQKAAVSRGWAGVDFRNLEMLDSRLERVSRYLPPALREILLHPFVYNIALMCRRLAPEAGSSRAARLVRAIPFLLPALAGERAEEVRAKLLIGSGEWTEGSDSDFNALQPKVERLSIEEKVTLLGSLRLKAGDRRSGEPGFKFPDFFDDEDEDDYEDGLFPGEEKSSAVDLARSLLLLHRSILGDISGRQAGLPLRDKKELVRVMEPVLLQDLDTILDAMEGPEEFQSLLDAAIVTGCAGVRLGLLAFLAGSSYRNADLRKHAEKLLDQTPAPTRQDMEWLAKKWSELYYPRARSLRPLLVRYKDESDLLAIFATQLCSMAEYDLFESALHAELLRLPSALAEIVGMRTKPEDFVILRGELDELTEHEALDPPRHFLRCFPGGRLSMDGHLCWLEALRSLRGVAVWEYAVGELKRCMRLDAPDPMDFSHSEKSLKKLLKDKNEALRLFMKEHLDELASLPMVTLEPLLNELLKLSTIQPTESTLLIRMEKLLAERAKGGEEFLRPLMDRLRQTLHHLARPVKRRTPQSRRSKR